MEKEACKMLDRSKKDRISYEHLDQTNHPPGECVRDTCGHYGTPQNDPDYDPLGGLVGTILSQLTSDINSERAYHQLVAAFPTWEEVRDAPTYKVAEEIKSGGLANIKSVRIQDVLHTLTEQQQAQGDTQTLAAYHL